MLYLSQMMAGQFRAPVNKNTLQVNTFTIDASKIKSIDFLYKSNRKCKRKHDINLICADINAKVGKG